MRKGYEMNKRRNKITIFIVAALMFTSTWAGVFAADPEQPAEETTPVENGIESQNSDSETTETEELDPAVTTKDDDEIALTVSAKASADGTIEVKWNAVDGAEYSVTETVNGGAAEDVNTEGLVPNEGNYTLTLLGKEAGRYQYTVTAKAEGKKDTSVTSSEVVIGLTEKVTNLEALSGYYCVELSWDVVEGVDGYLVLRYNNDTGKLSIRRELPNNSSNMVVSNGRVKWTNSVDVSTFINYRYEVYAVKQVKGNANVFSDANIVKSKVAAVIPDKGCVRPMYITLKLKKKRTLKSLNGGPKITLKKNTIITADGFGGGCYYFTASNGKRYRMARTSAKKQVAHYNPRGNVDYSKEEAVLFVNELVKRKGITTNKNYFIWVSFYSQKMYVMQRTAKGWEYYDSWDCATGKAATPSPTGDKAIGKKKKSHHNIKWWSSFSNPKSIANSIHGKKKGWKLGLPQSHGCIRNEVYNAKWVYDNCPKYTKVYNY